MSAGTRTALRVEAKRQRAAAAAADPRLIAIARGLGFPTLDTRDADSLDFREVSVWQLRAALEAAFLAGARSAK